MTVTVGLSGPLVQGDPGKIMLANLERAIEPIAEKGAEEARRGFQQGQGGRALIRELGDRVADHVVGRSFARPSKGGRRWHAYGVIQVYNEGLSAAGGRSLMAAASVLEGRSNVMRKITQGIGAQLRAIDLTKGIE